MTVLQLFVGLALGLVILGCNPRDPQLLSDEQKLSNYCFKRENRQAPACKELDELRAKSRSKKVFVQSQAAMDYSVYLLSRQSEMFRYLKLAQALAKNETVRDEHKCLSVVKTNHSSVLELIISYDNCPMASESSQVYATGTMTISVDKSQEGLVFIQVTARDFAVSGQKASTKNSLKTGFSSVEDIHLAALYFSSENSYLVKSYAVASKVSISKSSGTQELIQLKTSAMGPVVIEDDKMTVQIDKWALKYTATLDRSDSEKVFFDLLLSNDSSNSAAQNTETIKDFCPQRQMSYGLDFRFIPSMSLSNAMISAQGRTLLLKAKNRYQAETVTHFQLKDCTAVAGNNPLLKTHVYWDALTAE